MKRLFCLLLAVLIFAGLAACKKDTEKEKTNYVPIAAGFGHTLALKSDRTVVAMGYNDDG